MPLTPIDIHNKEFGRKLRGYNEVEVDEFLDQVVRDYESLLKERDVLNEQIEELKDKLDQYKELEDTLHNTLVVAQETAKEVQDNARKEANLIIKESRQRADDIVSEARQRAREAEQVFEDVKRQIRAFRARVKGMFQSHIELLDEDLQRDLAEIEHASSRPRPESAQAEATGPASEEDSQPRQA